jgi:hypothetical protein
VSNVSREDFGVEIGQLVVNRIDVPWPVRRVFERGTRWIVAGFDDIEPAIRLRHAHTREIIWIRFLRWREEFEPSSGGEVETLTV